ncbi:VOC family protein [Sandaracinobacteroides saxicola]|uniref:VOC family protein n=2 Tax=Sandaracinobacteroides saxicola TaxID=2759707 RepID=A0A7G5IM66_9SPHN|nr:VOC family protein [Sandaracinobacteroides saxicola]
MANHHGDWIWYELMTPDARAATAFYAPMLGWTVRDDPDYAEITASDGMVGGMLQLTPAMTEGGARPGWVGYVAVDNVDSMVGSITAGGGRLLMPARDMPGVGRFAMVADPHGAPFYVMTPTGEGEASAFSYDRPRLGHCAWNELMTPDAPAALHFYGQRFGWVADGGMDMPGIGRYDFLRHTGRGAEGAPHAMLGAMMPLMPGVPHAVWSFYFRVADIDAAVVHIQDHGGTLMQPPIEIPGGEYSLNAADPQGAHFGLVGPRL